MVGDYVDLQQREQNRETGQDVGGASSGRFKALHEREEANATSNVGIRKTSIIAEVIHEEVPNEDQTNTDD